MELLGAPCAGPGRLRVLLRTLAIRSAAPRRKDSALAAPMKSIMMNFSVGRDT
jgi:hypothetical protein